MTNLIFAFKKSENLSINDEQLKMGKDFGFLNYLIKISFLTNLFCVKKILLI